MTRVLLINPPSPERLGAPLLGQQYVAAALLAHGCEVRVIDAAARCFEKDVEWIVAEADRFQPHIIGMGLFTRWIWHAYRIVERFAGLGALLVAGGAHATVRPDETLERGFDVAMIGEAEESVVELVEVVEGRRALADVRGIRYKAQDGRVLSGLKGDFVQDLDALAMPHTAQSRFDPRWYDPSGREVTPGGVLWSRGCPARCTFCANYVTGRGFRYRSPSSVVDELNAYHALTGATFFPCWDDALTANLPHLLELCRTLEREIRFPLGWSAITRASMVRPDVLSAMRQAGCVHVNFGVESGDDQILRAIKKGITTEHVVRALEWAKAEGLGTACNFMLGFPQETPEALERTVRFMERIAPMVDSFSTLGVVVPFPGTPIYDDFHERFGFTDWWLREDFSSYTEAPDVSDADRFYRYYIDDSNLELDFFRYSGEMRAMIHEALRFKAHHNLRMMGLFKDPLFRPELVEMAAPR